MNQSLCCDPLKLFNAFMAHGGDVLRKAAFHIYDFGFEGAERMAEDSRDSMAIRALRSCSSSRGVDAIKMLDLLEDMEYMIDDVGMMLDAISQGDEDLVIRNGGREFVQRLRAIEC